MVLLFHVCEKLFMKYNSTTYWNLLNFALFQALFLIPILSISFYQTSNRTISDGLHEVSKGSWNKREVGKFKVGISEEMKTSLDTFQRKRKLSNVNLKLSNFSIFTTGYIDVVDGCWWRNVLATTLRCWWRFWAFASPTSSIFEHRH